MPTIKILKTLTFHHIEYADYDIGKTNKMTTTTTNDTNNPDTNEPNSHTPA